MPQATRSPYWLAAVVGLLAVLGACGLAWQCYRWDPAPPAAEPSPFTAGPRGLGGWLVLPLLALVGGALRIGRDMLAAAPAYEHARWLFLTTPGSQWYAPVNEWMLLFELVANIAMLVALLLVLALFLQRRSSLPRAYPLMIQGMLAVTVIDVLLTSQSPLTPPLGARGVGQLIGQAGAVALWTAYFRRSIRVRNTFVRRRSAPAAAPPAESPPGEPAPV